MGVNALIAKQVLLRRAKMVRVENRVVQELLDKMAEVRGRVMDGLASMESSPSAVPLGKATIGLAFKTGQKEITSLLSERLSEIASAEYAFQLRTLTRYIPEGARARVMGGEFNRELLRVPVGGVTYEEAVGRMFDRLKVGVDTEVRRSWAEGFQKALERGESPAMAQRTATAAIAETGVDLRKIQDLLSDKAGKQIDTIVRTHTQAAIDQATRQHHRENAHLLRGEEWCATLDVKTCPVCAGLHGKQWFYEGSPSVEEAPSIPIHPACRCARLPVVSEEIDPNPAPVASYEEWFKGLTPEEQKEILGPSRYNLWQSGEVDLKEMVSSDYRVLTLEELEGKAGEGAAGADFLDRYKELYDEQFNNALAQWYAENPGKEPDYLDLDILSGEAARKLQSEVVDAEIGAKLESLFAAQVEKATYEQALAVQEYCGLGFGPINRALRSGYIGTGSTADTIETLKRTFRSVEGCREPVYVYRGVMEAAPLAEAMKVGAVFADPGFVSTSLDPLIARGFSGKNAPIMRIRLTEGTKAIAPDVFLKSYPSIRESLLRENEVILQPETKFRVIGLSSEVDPVLQRRILDVEVIP